MNDSSPASAPACSICHGPTELRPNPYFGSGLSVHPHLRVCQRCSAVAFELVDDPIDAEEARGTTPRSLRGRLAAWYRALP
ncbi:hypothetical protein ACPEEZ_01100 [Frigoribacterium sp. 2-23]|uniref:hypothetical protein n=1 Tax=Frigoribacterium sp. 2-23 TaxID=3415006 RepID=UPI003C6ED121